MGERERGDIEDTGKNYTGHSTLDLCINVTDTRIALH